MRGLWAALVAICLAGLWGASALAQGAGQAGQGTPPDPALTALARLAEPPRLQDTRRGAVLELSLTQPVPWRVFTLDAPPRLVLDFS
ncbi:MAG: N-acetylmuramoyl-L-alanine amidase, partial [Rhodobacterales bacterium]